MNNQSSNSLRTKYVKENILSYYNYNIKIQNDGETLKWKWEQ